MSSLCNVLTSVFAGLILWITNSINLIMFLLLLCLCRKSTKSDIGTGLGSDIGTGLGIPLICYGFASTIMHCIH